MFKVAFANILGGLVFAGHRYGDVAFSRVSIKEYKDFFKDIGPDILSLAEVHAEDQSGKSEMTKYLAEELGLPHYTCMPQSASHLDTSKRLGLAILSRFPIIDKRETNLPNPKLEVDRPDGSRWIMHDKGVQFVTLQMDQARLSFVNLHFFPFSHFGRSLNEPEFSSIRKDMVNVLLSSDASTPTIITGDFNNFGCSLQQQFPELFSDQRLQESILTTTTVVGREEQLDHILFTPAQLKASKACAAKNLSDHYALVADFEFVQN